jgi:hypothetical protein
VIGKLVPWFEKGCQDGYRGGPAGVVLLGIRKLMMESNLLPYEGEAILIHEASTDVAGSGFDWVAVTRTLIDTMPWRVETARCSAAKWPCPV